MADKPKLKYRVIPARNPSTGAALLRPVIAERDTLRTDQVVEYALNAGYVRGQFHDMRGALNGFIEAIQQLGRDGKSINLNDWLRIHGELTGSVDATRQLSAKNGYKVAITPLKELKRSVNDFSWTNVDAVEGAVKIDHVYYADATEDFVIKNGAAIVINGKNLKFDASLGDKLTFSWTDSDGEAQSAEVAPSSSDAFRMSIAWPAALAEVAAGTEVTLELRSRNGVKDAPEQVVTKKVKLVG